ncbi:MAG: hypothetical protein QOD99_3072 [Chthoniobacter sp.]|jgi:hypothetical protein|nr:hypothetical protein [Chthoniobacter sp.]
MQQQSVSELIQAHLNQPEYLHALLNPLPVYGIAIGVAVLAAAIGLRNRAAQITGLAVLLASALSVWPVIHYGELGFDRILTQADEGGTNWLDAHAQRAERAEPAFYALAAIAAVAMAVPRKFPKSELWLNGLTLIAAIAVLFLGAWIAYAGGQIRHREFRYDAPPEPRGGYEKMRD